MIEPKMSLPSKVELKKVTEAKRKEKIKAIKNLGIYDNKAVKYFTESKGINIDDIKNKLKAFEKAGFRNPVKLFNKYPPIFNFEAHRLISFVQERLLQLEYFDFNLSREDIITIIEKFPPVINDGILPLDARKKILKELKRSYSKNFSNVKEDKNS